MALQPLTKTEAPNTSLDVTAPITAPPVSRLTARRVRRPRRTTPGTRVVVAVGLALSIWLVAPGTRVAPLPAWALAPVRDVTREAARIVSSYAVEEPRLLPASGSSPLPLCARADEQETRRLAPGFAMMRGTPEGERLFQALLDHDVCVRVDSLPYNSGYTRAVRDIDGTWAESEIVVDDALVQANEPDVLAALLVHEATHLDRAVDGTACWYEDACTELANGVRLEEEIAAHRAEAAWWLAAYGADGKRFAFRADHSMNQLTRAYLAGWESFVDYVQTLRGDEREGTGIDIGASE